MTTGRIKTIFTSSMMTVIVLVGLLFFTIPSRASLINFNIGPINSGASISYGGSGGSLTGSNISVYAVTGMGTSSNNNTAYNITGGVLSFTTGNFVGSGSNSWRFGSGTLILSGTVNLGGSTISGNLFEGWLNNASVIDLGIYGFKVTIGAVSGSVLDELAELYGLTTGLPYAGSLDLSFIASGSPPGAFTSISVLGGNLAATPVPAPSTMLLLASGLLGLVGLSRKFKK